MALATLVRRRQLFSRYGSPTHHPPLIPTQNHQDTYVDHCAVVKVKPIVRLSYQDVLCWTQLGSLQKPSGKCAEKSRSCLSRNMRHIFHIRCLYMCLEIGGRVSVSLRKFLRLNWIFETFMDNKLHFFASFHGQIYSQCSRPFAIKKGKSGTKITIELQCLFRDSS